MRGADAVVKTLVAHGTRLVIGYVGHSVQEIGDALLDEPSIRTFHPRTEMGGGYIVNGYNKVKGRAEAVAVWHTVGSYVATVTLYDALCDRVPSVTIGANVPTRLKDRDAMQEMRNVEVFRSITKYCTRVERPDKIPDALHRAFQMAETGRRGPAFVDLPFDLAVDQADITLPDPWSPPAYRPAADQDSVAEACRLLLAAKRPVLVAGGGCADAADEVRELAELLQMPVATSSVSKGLLPEDHPLSVGVAGAVGWPVANDCVARADVVLAAGYRFGDWGYAQGYIADMPGRLIHIDLDPAELDRFYYAAVPILADARRALRQIIDTLKAQLGTPRRAGLNGEWVQARAEWLKQMAARESVDSTPASPWRVMRELRRALKPDAYVVTDVGNNAAWVIQGFQALAPNRLLMPNGLGALGTAFPLALGAKLADPAADVLCVTGDGGFHYTLTELATAVQQDIPVVVVVLNDGFLGANRGIAEHIFGGRYQWVAINDPDFVALARAFGADGERVQEPGAIADAVRRGLKARIPYVVDLAIDPTIPYPQTGHGAVRWAPVLWPKDPTGSKDPGDLSRRREPVPALTGRASAGDRARALLQGAIDLHMHTAPDVFPRSVTDVEAAEQAKAAGMAAIVIKNHGESTATRATLASALAGFPVFGGIALNHPVGGLNPEAVRETFRAGGVEIWMPTVHAAHHLKSPDAVVLFASQADPGVRGISILEGAEIKPEVSAIVELIAAHDGILSTGHVSPEEAITLVRAARDRGVERILVTHPHAVFLGYTLDELRTLVRLGAVLELHYAFTTRAVTQPNTIADLAGLIQAVGPDHCVLATDGGQAFNPPPVEMLRRFVEGLLREDIPETALDVMVRANPSRILDRALRRRHEPALV
jgi:acetolactate synthase-1/2/3 large subunit